jgi:hypothetical protein
MCFIWDSGQCRLHSLDLHRVSVVKDSFLHYAVISLLSLSWGEKNKSRFMRSPCCLYEYMYHPFINFWIAEAIIMKLGYVYQGTWDHHNGIIHKSLTSVIPILQPLKFLRKNLNIAWMLVPIFMRLGMYMMSHEAMSKVYFIHPFDQWLQPCKLLW